MINKRLFQLSQIILMITGIYIFFKFFPIDIAHALLGPISILFLLVPIIVDKVLHMKLSYQLKIMINLFFTTAFQLGTALYFYHRIASYDIIMHFTSGFVFTLIGFCLYRRFNSNFIDRKTDIFLQLTYAFFFCLFIAVVWEIAEFSGFILFGMDTQHHLTTGVFDTMEDLIVCFIGGVFCSLDYLYYTKKDKSIFKDIVISFDEVNK